MKKAFSEVLHARSKVKEFFSNSENLVNLAKSILNGIYTTLQAETLILTCPPFSLFSCQSFRPGGSPFKADSHDDSHIAVYRYEYDVRSMVLFYRNIISLVII